MAFKYAEYDHGPIWLRCCEYLGGNAQPHHSYTLPVCMWYRCPCGQLHNFSRQRQNLAALGVCFTCTTCGGRLWPAGEKEYLILEEIPYPFAVSEEGPDEPIAA